MSVRSIAVPVIVLMLSGCVTAITPRGYTPTEFSNPYRGLIYSGGKETLKVFDENSGPSSKGGYVCNKSVLGLVTWGSQSVEEAQKKGGVNKIHKVEVVRSEILSGFASEQCLIVRGE